MRNLTTLSLTIALTAFLPIALSTTVFAVDGSTDDYSREGATRFAPGAISRDGQITLTPAFTPDGKTAYFPQSDCDRIGPCPQTLHKSSLINGQWTPAKAVALPQSGRVDWPNITPDGRYLLISWSAQREKYAALDVYEDFDLYRVDLTQTPLTPEPLDMADINRPRAGAIKKLRYVHNESSPVMTNNGDLYFWTERFDGIGERDIYVAPMTPQGEYAIARPLPAPINSKGRDNHAWISPKGGLMLLTYNERGGVGRDDIFISRNTNGVWSDPAPLGPRVNSRYSDFGAKLTPDGKHVVFTSDRPYADATGRATLQVWSVNTAELIADGVVQDSDLSR